MSPLPQNAVKERASEGNKDGWLTCAPQKVDPAVRDLPFCGSQPLNLRQVRTSSRPWRALDQNVLVRYAEVALASILGLSGGLFSAAVRR